MPLNKEIKPNLTLFLSSKRAISVYLFQSIQIHLSKSLQIYPYHYTYIYIYIYIYEGAHVWVFAFLHNYPFLRETSASNFLFNSNRLLVSYCVFASESNMNICQKFYSEGLAELKYSTEALKKEKLKERKKETIFPSFISSFSSGRERKHKNESRK